jgi:hypothetical protein
MPRSKREWSFALIRTVIIVSVVGAAAWFLAIAYAPQWFAPRSPLQALNCPPLAVIDRETVVSPQAFVTSAQAQTPDNDSHVLIDSSTGLRPPNAKQQERRISLKKPPRHTLAGKPFSPERPLSGEPAKRGGSATNQKKPNSSSPTTALAQSTPYPSPFGDLHGQ